MFNLMQSEFKVALLDPGQPVPSSVTSHTAMHPTKRFGVYRNNVIVSLVEALRTRFPAVEKIVGDEFFTAMARLFVIGHPPSSPILMTYGDKFADFIEGFVPAAGLTYLADVARLEAARSRAFHAEDAEPLDSKQLRQLDPWVLREARLMLHPSVQVVRSEYPIVTIWAMNSGEAELRPIDGDGAEDALVIRPSLDVAVYRLPPGGAGFLESLADGRSLGEAAERAGVDYDEFDLAKNLAGLMRSGAVTSLLLKASERSQGS
jgi:Putative DNA-binding domain